MPENSSSGIDSPRAWLIVVAAFIGSFVAFGITYTFGVFLKPMRETFGTSHSSMSLLFSCLTGLSFFLAPFTGDIADRVGPRVVVGAGAVLMGAGLIFTARTHSFAMLFLTYGAGVGASIACIYVPTIAAVGEWFKIHRDIALGIAISGIGCGTLVYAPLAAILIKRFGWRSAFEIFGWSSAALLLICAALLSQPPVLNVMRKKRTNVMEKVRTAEFAWVYISMTFAALATYITFVFLPAYATDVGVRHIAGAALIGYIGASSVVGRLGLNALAPRFGLLMMYKVSFLVLLASYVVWLVAHSYISLVIFSLVMGVGYGGIAAMSPAVAAVVFGIEGLGELLVSCLPALAWLACLVLPLQGCWSTAHTITNGP